MSLVLLPLNVLSLFSLQHFFCISYRPYANINIQENGHSSMYSWILSTGWWINRAPVNPDAVIVVGFLCTCLIVGFIYINRCLFLKFDMLLWSYYFQLWVWSLINWYCTAILFAEQGWQSLPENNHINRWNSFWS